MRDSESVSEKIFPLKGENILAQGNALGTRLQLIFEALKGRNIIIVMHIYFALSGLYYAPILLHRALPCAEISCPFRALNWHLLNILIILATRTKFLIMNII